MTGNYFSTPESDEAHRQRNRANMTLAETPDEEVKPPESHSYDCSVCDNEPEGCPGCGSAAYESGWTDAITKVNSIYLARQEQAVQKARQEERERIFGLLDLHENDMGFCEISNHVPWDALKYGES